MKSFIILICLFFIGVSAWGQPCSATIYTVTKSPTTACGGAAVTFTIQNLAASYSNIEWDFGTGGWG